MRSKSTHADKFLINDELKKEMVNNGFNRNPSFNSMKPNMRSKSKDVISQNNIYGEILDFNVHEQSQESTNKITITNPEHDNNQLHTINNTKMSRPKNASISNKIEQNYGKLTSK